MVATQVGNCFFLYANYGGWTQNHTVILIACGFALCVVPLIRWYKNLLPYALFYSVLLIGACVATALIDGSGINTSILPLFALGPIINAFIAGRKAAIFFWVIGMIALSCIFLFTSSQPSYIEGIAGIEHANRYTHAILALTISLALALIVSEQLFLALSDMRKHAAMTRKAEQEKSKFFAIMSHELRTPLNGVIGLLDAYGREVSPDRRQQLFGKIRSSADTMLVTLNDVLDLSKLEAGAFEIRPRAFKPQELVTEIAETWREAAMAKGLELSFKIDPAIPDQVLADDVRVRQILQNLLSNAVKFTAQGSVELQVSFTPVSEEKIQILFSVSDSGQGIAETVKSRIFDPYVQAEDETDSANTGTGLGLSISRQLAEAMGGTLVLRQSGPAGSVFDLSIPCQYGPTECEYKVSRHETKTPTAPEAMSLRVLIAEDNPVNVLVYQELLKPLGVDPHIVENGRDCLICLDTEYFDLVLMDKHMPVMDGVTALREIRLRGDGAPLVVAVTADVLDGERQRLLDAGFDDVLPKPVRTARLREILARAERHRRVFAVDGSDEASNTTSVKADAIG